MCGAGGEEADEPRIVVERFQRGHDEAAPGERAAECGRADGAPVPASISAIDEVEILELQFAAAYQPVVGDQHAGDRAEASRVAEQPREDIPRWIREQLPRLNHDAEDPGDQPAGLEADETWKGVRKVIRR